MLQSNTEVETNILSAIDKAFLGMSQDLASLSVMLQKVATKHQQSTRMNFQSANQVILDSVNEGLSEAAKKKLDKSCTELLLHSLNFQQQQDRYSTIEKPHSRTFSWIFQDNSHLETPWYNFVQWLRSDSGRDHLYWVAGKPGSGKSTLMRFLYDDRRTHEILQQWATGRKLVTASCFF